MNEDLGVSFENDEIFEEDGSLINQDNQIVEGVKKALDGNTADVFDGSFLIEENDSLKEQNKDLQIALDALEKEAQELRAKVESFKSKKETKFKGKEEMEAEIDRLTSRLKRARSTGAPEGMSR